RLRQLADLLDEGKGHHIVARELLASAPQLGEDLRSERLRLPLAARGAEEGGDLHFRFCDPVAVWMLPYKPWRTPPEDNRMRSPRMVGPEHAGQRRYAVRQSGNVHPLPHVLAGGGGGLQRPRELW